MNLHGKAHETAHAILEAFREPDKLGARIAPAFYDLDLHCAEYSLRNRAIVMMAGYSDAMGFHQWKDVGRKVKKGAKALYILAPCTVKVKDENGDDAVRVTGFRAVPVFGYEATEGKEIKLCRVLKHMESLPFINLARAWGIQVKAIDAQGQDYLGRFIHTRNPADGGTIEVGTQGPRVWLHEFVHAADHKLGNLKTNKAGQYWENEIVAEFGACILCNIVGGEWETRRNSYDYILHYAKEAGMEPEAAALKMFSRTLKAVEFILSESAAAESKAASA